MPARALVVQTLSSAPCETYAGILTRDCEQGAAACQLESGGKPDVGSRAVCRRCRRPFGQSAAYARVTGETSTGKRVDRTEPK